MEWSLKAPFWDSENIGMVSNKCENHMVGLQELGEEAQQSIGSVVEPYGREGQKSQADCFVDLKLGRLGDFGDGLRSRDHREVMVSPPAVPGSSRRPRTINGSNQAVFCLVEGCTSDFSSCKDYHKKHKVCDVHSKTPKVTVDGREQRFCQQCSRFHLLAEFDGGKKSCRTRLDGHNKRRRKQKPDFLSRNSGSLFASFQGLYSVCKEVYSCPNLESVQCTRQVQILGTKYSTYINSQMFPTTVQEPNWTGAIKAEDGIYSCYPPLSLAGTVPCSYKEGKQFPFLHTTASSGSSSQMFTDGLTRVFDSDCALSLLSSPSQPPVINLGNTVQDNRVSIAQPLIQGMKYSGHAQFSCDKLLPVACCSQGSNSVSSSGFSCSGMEDEQVSAVLVSDASDADLRCTGIFHVVDVGSSESGPMQTPPFSWH